MPEHVVVAQLPDVADHAAPADPGAVEPKVRAATAAASTAAGLLLPLLLWLLARYVGAVPAEVQVALSTIVTGACTFAAGYYARHVDRSPTRA